MISKLSSYRCQVNIGNRIKNIIVVTERGKCDQFLYSKFGFGCIISSEELDGDVLINLSDPEVGTTTELDMLSKIYNT